MGPARRRAGRRGSRQDGSHLSDPLRSEQCPTGETRSCSRSAYCPLRKTSCHRRREEKFPPQRRRGAENAENAEEYANSHCLCDLCVLCASAVKVLVLLLLLTASGSKPSFAKVSLQPLSRLLLRVALLDAHMR